MYARTPDAIQGYNALVAVEWANELIGGRSEVAGRVFNRHQDFQNAE
jgi:hypothetical protein